MLKCSNHIICNNTVDKDTILCSDCEMLFGTWRGYKGILPTKKDCLCTVCSKKDLCLSRPDCDHFICSKCFTILYYSCKKEFLIEDDNLSLSEKLLLQNNLKKCAVCK